MSEPASDREHEPQRAGEPPLMTHEYDGIQEYDNPLPGWWKGIFLATIVFSPIYIYWYHLGGPGRSAHAAFEADWKEYAAHRAEMDRITRLDVTEPLLAEMGNDPAVMAAGRQLFQQACVGCHLADGSGSVGPNLTDEYQIHGTGRLDLYATIRDGVAGTAMISWGATMRDRDVAALTVYVASMRGQKLPGKPPEGGKVGGW